LAAAVNSTGLFADIDVVATLLVSTTGVPTKLIAAKVTFPRRVIRIIEMIASLVVTVTGKL
jgi:hypothetical protein